MSEERKGGQTIYINDLYEADEEAPPHPENKYEIAEGVVVPIRKPTIGLQERFEEIDEELTPLYERINAREEAKKRLEQGKLEEGDLPEGVTLREVQRQTREVAAKQAFEVLDLEGHDLEREQIFGPMAVVVRAHFFSLSTGIGARLSASSTEKDEATE